jgi:excisionase family DNA binding protein
MATWRAKAFGLAAPAAAVLQQSIADERSPYLNVDEAAEYLRCDRQRIYDLVSSGRLTRLKDGSRLLLLRQDLDNHVASALPPAARTRMNIGDAA